MHPSSWGSAIYALAELGGPPNGLEKLLELPRKGGLEGTRNAIRTTFGVL